MKNSSKIKYLVPFCCVLLFINCQRTEEELREDRPIFANSFQLESTNFATPLLTQVVNATLINEEDNVVAGIMDTIILLANVEALDCDAANYPSEDPNFISFDPFPIEDQGSINRTSGQFLRGNCILEIPDLQTQRTYDISNHTLLIGNVSDTSSPSTDDYFIEFTFPPALGATTFENTPASAIPEIDGAVFYDLANENDGFDVRVFIGSMDIDESSVTDGRVTINRFSSSSVRLSYLLIADGNSISGSYDGLISN